MTTVSRRSTLAAVLSGVVAISMAASLLDAMPAAAATTCSGTRSNYHDGYQTLTVTTTGTAADIMVRYPTLCTGAVGGASFSSAWTMLTGAGDPAGWAQTGYLRDPLFAGVCSMDSVNIARRPRSEERRVGKECRL